MQNAFSSRDDLDFHLFDSAVSVIMTKSDNSSAGRLKTKTTNDYEDDSTPKTRTSLSVEALSKKAFVIASIKKWLTDGTHVLAWHRFTKERVVMRSKKL